MTEEEAKTKWCAHAIASHTNPRGKARWDENGFEITEERFSHNCIGSRCMAWRDAGPKVEQKIVHRQDRKILEQRGWRYIISYDDGNDLIERCESTAEHVGYCGLAGKP